MDSVAQFPNAQGRHEQAAVAHQERQPQELLLLGHGPEGRRPSLMSARSFLFGTACRQRDNAEVIVEDQEAIRFVRLARHF